MSQKTAFLFPGQGAQNVGMGKDFYENFSIAKETFEEADDLLSLSLSKVIFEGPMETLTKTNYSQIAIYVTSTAIYRVIQDQMPSLAPYLCAGLSLGEYTALSASNWMSFSDGLSLVKVRGDSMQEASLQNPGSLAVVLGLSPDLVFKEVEKIENLWVANLNCPGQVVISGSLDALKIAADKLKQAGAKRVLPLDVSGAFHSGLMQPAQEKLSEKLDQTNFQQSNIKICMNVPGALVTDINEMRSYLRDQVVATTKWEQGIRSVMDDIDLFVEIGPGKTLSGMNKKIGVPSQTISIDKIDDLEKLTTLG